jgi:hypothetical protein
METSSDYYESDNFKRNNTHELEEEASSENLKNYDYIRELIKERNQLDSESHASRLLDQGDYQLSGGNCNENSYKFIDFISTYFRTSRNSDREGIRKAFSRQQIRRCLPRETDSRCREVHSSGERTSEGEMAKL